VLRVAVALLPVLVFLAILVLMDSFKLVSLRSVLRSIAAGGVAALLAAALNVWMLEALSLPTTTLSRYFAPLTEELLKALPMVYLIRRRQVGFLVDAAIHGFALGAGFALVENVYYLRSLEGASPLLWIVRGFGTALLHGATTTMFATVSKSVTDRHPEWSLAGFAPGWLSAAVLHSAFNHFPVTPLAQTAILLVVVPLLLVAVFERSEKGTREWLGVGFDTEVEILQQVTSNALDESRIGQYLRSLTSRFEGLVVADMLCLLRIQLELSLRAKGVLMAREAGLPIEIGPDVRANLEELGYLEKSIGRTGLLALHPILRTSSRDLWQIYMLDSSAAP